MTEFRIMRAEPLIDPWVRKSRMHDLSTAMLVLFAIVTMSVVCRADGDESIARELRQKAWIHATSPGPGGKETVEHWFNPVRQLSAVRARPIIFLHDGREKTFAKYVPSESTLYLLPEPPAAERDQTLVKLLEEFEAPKPFAYSGYEVTKRIRRELEEDGKKWIEYVLTLKVAGGSRGGPHTMLIRVEPQTNLPQSLTIQDDKGSRDKLVIDYPESGPADIYDLGVPRTATIIDRIPSDDVRQILSQRAIGRQRFDDHTGFVLEERILPVNRFPRVEAYRISRKGLKWRIDRLRPLKEDWMPPAGAKVAWWNEHLASFVAIPRIICDGPAYWDYYLGDDWKPGTPVSRGPGKVIGPNGLQGLGEDPDLPFWCQDLLPSQAGHPTAGIGEPDGDRAFVVDAKPLDGPVGTILFYARDPLKQKAGPDHFRIWIDPGAGYLSKRTEIRVADAKDHSKTAFIDTHVVESAEKSPTGRWYPTKTRHISRNGDDEVVRTFYLDFETLPLTEEFEPIP